MFNSLVNIKNTGGNKLDLSDFDIDDDFQNRNWNLFNCNPSILGLAAQFTAV